MILVTGGSGFIGGNLVERLIAGGERVRCLVRRRAVAAHARVESVPGDLLTGSGVAEALEGVDRVIHLAGVTKVLRASEYERGNVLATETLAQAIARAGRPIRLVHVSSLAAVGPAAEDAPVTEDAPPRPVGHYGRSKLAGERKVREIVPGAVIVRPPVVYGPRDTDVFELLRSISMGVVLEIAGGERYFSAIYVEDLADGLIAAARAPGATGRTYFLAHRQVVSWTEFARLAQRVMGIRARVLRVPRPIAHGVGWGAEIWAQFSRKPGIISRDKVAEAVERWWTCDPARAAAELGFTAKTPIEEGLPRTLAWYREAGWLKY